MCPLRGKGHCYPLTISDYRSRYLLGCEGLQSTKSDFAFSVFERTFKDFGLPHAIRTDNGTPFAAPCAMFGQGPHQALGGAYPGEVYTPSAREYRPPDEPEYPYHDRTQRVTRCGRICIGRRKINFSVVFAGQLVGIREVADEVWQVSFMQYDLGCFDKEQDRVEPGPNPFAPDKVLTMCPV